MLRNRGKRTSSLYGYRRKLKTNLHENVRKSRLTREKQRLLQDEEGVISFEKPVVLPDAVSNFLDVNGEPENFYADDTAYYVLLSDHPRVSIRNPKRYLCFAGHRLLQGAPPFFETIAFKHGIINYKDIGMVFRIQRNNGISDDFGGKNRCETNPVDLDHLHKMIHRILCKSRSIMVSNQVHVNAYVKKLAETDTGSFLLQN